jgi:hypothetical protein
MQLGDNARAALITRGLAEMMRLGQALRARCAKDVGAPGRKIDGSLLRFGGPGTDRAQETDKSKRENLAHEKSPEITVNAGVAIMPPTLSPYDDRHFVQSHHLKKNKLSSDNYLSFYYFCQ